jgi:hypothetical protein
MLYFIILKVDFCLVTAASVPVPYHIRLLRSYAATTLHMAQCSNAGAISTSSISDVGHSTILRVLL